MLDRVHLAADIEQIVDYDLAYGNGFLIGAFVRPQANGQLAVFATIVDASSVTAPNAQGLLGGRVVSTQLVNGANVQAPKLIVCGTTALLTWQVVRSYSVASPELRILIA